MFKMWKSSRSFLVLSIQLLRINHLLDFGHSTLRHDNLTSWIPRPSPPSIPQTSKSLSLPLHQDFDPNKTIPLRASINRLPTGREVHVEPEEPNTSSPICVRARKSSIDMAAAGGSA
jgi:hypothetical protein